jgi:hypothetical protein
MNDLAYNLTASMRKGAVPLGGAEKAAKLISEQLGP